MTGEITKLANAGHADISTTIVNNRGGSAHGRRPHIISTVIQMQAAQGIFCKGAVCLYPDLIEVATLGGEVVGIGCGIVHNAAALVAYVGQLLLIQQNTGGGMQGQNGSGAGGVTVRTVIRTNQHIILASVSTCPIEAVVGIGPGCQLGFGGIGGILIGHGQTDEVCLLGFAVPETGIDVAIAISNGTVGLTTQCILVHPQRGQVFSIKCLHSTIGQCHEDHAVSIGGRVDGKAGRTGHFTALDHLTGFFVDLVDGIACIGVQIAAHDDGAAGSTGIKAFADLVGPFQDCIFGLDGSLHIHNAVIVVIGTELQPIPFDGNVRQSRLRSLLQVDGDVLILLAGSERGALCHIAGLGDHIGVGAICIEDVTAISFRINAGFGDIISQVDRCVCRVYRKGSRHGRQFIHFEGVGLCHRTGLLVGNGYSYLFCSICAAQRNIHSNGICNIRLSKGNILCLLTVGNGHSIQRRIICVQITTLHLECNLHIGSKRGHLCGVVQNGLIEGCLCRCILLCYHQSIAVVICCRHIVQSHGTMDR